ncbi:MAG: DNA repair protein RecO [Proteobacteria bacterium]|jgi:DNA repair protein RecO (recombination protein O)|nr:DNA repair protein RecO [Pseudomonadota bacterium]
MSRKEVYKGIVLRKTKYKEADLILQILLSQGTKMSFLARGALRSKKRFGGGILEPTHYIQMTVSVPSAQERMGVIEEAHLIAGFDWLRLDYDKLETALWMLETVNKISVEGETESADLFNILGNSFRGLQHGSQMLSSRIQFGLKVLHSQGVLEVESWMKDYLSVSLIEQSHLPAPDTQTLARFHWIESQLSQYAQQGSV